MPSAVKGFVRMVDAINYRLGRFAMYLIFAMMAILLWSSISKTFFLPSLWTLEMAQFAMVAYYLLGGPYSMQGKDDAHVRMDLFYGSWSPKTKAAVDAVIVFFLIFYLGVLLYGGIDSAAYSLGHFKGEPFTFFKDLVVTFFTEGGEAAGKALGYLERSNTAWRPWMWPIKLTMCIGIFLMILQALAEFFRDIARIRGEAL
ncbi:MAG: C4-dicarboxylate ABC transporter [Hyphomicrobiales bacterium]|nr:MAG: C4-dicarboxylate ABC transporter [Hyphomicrobiales bacterium]